MHLNCPECNTLIITDGVNIAKMIAVCSSCDNVFTFEEKLRQAGELKITALASEPESDLSPRLKEPIYYIPSGVKVMKRDNMLEIVIGGRRSGGWIILFFAVFFTMSIGSILIAQLLMGLLSGWWPTFFTFIVLPFVGIGAYLLYWILGRMLNTTLLTVNNQYISIEHRSMSGSMPRDKLFNRNHVAQLHVERYVKRKFIGKHLHAYAVTLQMQDGRSYKLIKHLRRLKSARFIEQAIEEYMDIEDRAVEGEWRGNIFKKAE